MTDLNVKNEQKNRLAWTLDTAIKHNVPIARPKTDGTWSHGISIFVKEHALAQRNLAPMPGFVSEKLGDVMRRKGLIYIELTVNRSDEQMTEIVRNEGGQPKRRLAGAFLLGIGSTTMNLLNNPKLHMERAIKDLDKTFVEESGGDFRSLTEGGILVPIEKALEGATEEELILWETLKKERNGILGSTQDCGGYLVNIQDGSASEIFTNDRFNVLAKFNQAKNSGAKAPAANRTPSTDEGAPF